jgi:hypothetical protein
MQPFNPTRTGSMRAFTTVDPERQGVPVAGMRLHGLVNTRPQVPGGTAQRTRPMSGPASRPIQGTAR